MNTVAILDLNKNEIALNVKPLIELIHGWEYCSWNEENFLYELPYKWDFSFACVDRKSQRIIGFCIGSKKQGSTFYIHLFFISSSWRGHGLGKMMLDESCRRAQKAACKSLTLRCPTSNVEALSFYQKNDFKIIETVSDEVSGDVADHILEFRF